MRQIYCTCRHYHESTPIVLQQQTESRLGNIGIKTNKFSLFERKSSSKDVQIRLYIIHSSSTNTKTTSNSGRVSQLSCCTNSDQILNKTINFIVFSLYLTFSPFISTISADHSKVSGNVFSNGEYWKKQISFKIQAGFPNCLNFPFQIVLIVFVYHLS